jgi:hypothetical protein
MPNEDRLRQFIGEADLNKEWPPLAWQERPASPSRAAPLAARSTAATRH